MYGTRIDKLLVKDFLISSVGKKVSEIMGYKQSRYFYGTPNAVFDLLLDEIFVMRSVLCFNEPPNFNICSRNLNGLNLIHL